MLSSVFVTGAVEGITDEAVLRRICTYAGAKTGTVYGKSGKQHILTRISGYNNSARYRHWLVLLDLDMDADCAPAVLGSWLAAPAALMCLRIAVHELEAWILSDRERFAEFFSVSLVRVPLNPDLLPDPKAALVSLAQSSRKSDIRVDMVPRPGSGQAVGPAYASRVIEFVQDTNAGWRPEVAEQSSDSLRRCIAAIRHLAVQPFPSAH